jgi:hypothetical protein
MQHWQSAQIDRPSPARQIALHPGRDSIQRVVTMKLQRPDADAGIEIPVDRFARR